MNYLFHDEDTRLIFAFLLSASEGMPGFWHGMTQGGKEVMSPIFDALYSSGRRDVYPFSRGSDHRFQEAQELLEKIAAKEERVIACALISEVWTAVAVPNSTLGVSEREDRAENVLLHVQIKNRRDLLFRWPIERDESGARLGVRAVCEIDPSNNRMMPKRVVTDS